jgi:hypothetical protein
MTTPFFGTWVVIAPTNTPPEYIARARKLVGELLYRSDSGAGDVLKCSIGMPDGGTITATINGTMPIVQITLPTAQPQTTATIFNMWVPRGFVLYPAWTAQPYGVGLPIIAASGAGPYDPANMAPGLDISRWTAGGPCGEVLLSADTDAGYIADNFIPTPLLYDTIAPPLFQWSGTVPFDARPLASAWTPYRLELSPFTNVGNGANPAEQQALFEGINTLRANANVPAAPLRLRGLARLAEITATQVSANGSVAPTGPGWPLSYATAADRITKEGYAADWTQENFPSFNRTDIYTGTEFLAAANSAGALSQWQADPTLGPALVLNAQAIFTDVGSMPGYSTAQMCRRDRWIAAGNMSWQATDTGIPPLSWHGFPSLDLAWETFPCTYQTGNLSAPLAIAVNFTDSDGDCWLSYPRATSPTPETAEIAMGRHIYSRGRAIAMAPNGGLVWGACVYPNATQGNDRLILLAHHPADQNTDTLHQGFTRYLRVWWCDIPQRALRVDPPFVIVGTATGDTYAWQGGTLVDLGNMPASATGKFTATGSPNSLKYASQWRFSQGGTRAVCLRDYAGFIDYEYLTSYGSSNAMGSRAVELLFTPSGASLSVQTVYHDFVASMANYEPSQGQQGSPITLYPNAVDYATGTTNLLYIYTGHTTVNNVVTTFVGTGNGSTAGVGNLLYGAAISTNDYRVDDFDAFVLACSDVNSAAFTASGVHVYSVTDPTTGAVTVNPNYVCWPFTSNPAFGVRQFYKGQKVSEKWYGVPNGALVTGSPPCTLTGGAVILNLANSFVVQPYWASRFGEYVFSYQVSPTPNATLFLAAPPIDPPGSGCGCQPSSGDVPTMAWMTNAQLAPFGGYTVASVTLPDMDWTIFAKVV